VRLIYTPEDGPTQTLLFRAGKVRSTEAEAVEDLGYWSDWDEFVRDFWSDNRRAYRAALWLCLRRTDPDLAFDDLDYPVDALIVDFEDDERAALLAAIEADTDGDPAVRSAALARLGKDEPDDSATGSPSQPPGSEPSPSNSPGT